MVNVLGRVKKLKKVCKKNNKNFCFQQKLIFTDVFIFIFQ